MMYASALSRSALAPSSLGAAALAALYVNQSDRDTPGLSLPRAEIHLVARFGPSTKSGVDVHAMGVRERVHRKLIRGGQSTVTARLRLGAQQAVLGVPASALAGRIVSLDELWGDLATRRLLDQLGTAANRIDAAAILEGAIAARVASADRPRAYLDLVRDAAQRLTTAHVSAVADHLRVSERHLRRLFRETVGVGPKTFARLERFRRALRAARNSSRKTVRVNWAGVASAAGYYDQAHLIGEFRLIAGVTPQALLTELEGALSMGG